MTADLFVSTIVEYYGPYSNDLVEGAVRRYVDGMTAEKRATLFQWVIGTYSNVYGRPPDIAKLEESWKAREKWRNDNAAWFADGTGKVTKQEPVYLPLNLAIDDKSGD